MASIHTLIDLFKSDPSVQNANKLVAKTIHHPMSICLVLEDGIATVQAAKQLLADFEEYINSEAAGV